MLLETKLPSFGKIGLGIAGRFNEAAYVDNWLIRGIMINNCRKATPWWQFLKINHRQFAPAMAAAAASDSEGAIIMMAANVISGGARRAGNDHVYQA